jgi:hypothetical protein
LLRLSQRTILGRIWNGLIVFQFLFAIGSRRRGGPARSEFYGSPEIMPVKDGLDVLERVPCDGRDFRPSPPSSARRVTAGYISERKVVGYISLRACLAPTRAEAVSDQWPLHRTSTRFSQLTAFRQQTGHPAILRGRHTRGPPERTCKARLRGKSARESHLRNRCAPAAIIAFANSRRLWLT